MEKPKQQAFHLENFPTDILAYVVCYLPGEMLGRLKTTGATILWKKLTSQKVIKSVNLGTDDFPFKTCPAFLAELPSLEQLLVDRPSVNSWSEMGLTLDQLPSTLRKLVLKGNHPFFFGKIYLSPSLDNILPNLEILDLFEVDFHDYSWLALSPPTLTDLSIRSWDGGVELPSSLIHFRSRHVKLGCNAKIPSTLETFDTSQLASSVDSLLPLLPSSLQKLAVFSFVDCFEDGVLVGLPPSLTTLKLNVTVLFEFRSALPPSLPATLTTLVVSTFIPCSLWALLPPVLKNLSFEATFDLCTLVWTFTNETGEICNKHYLPLEALPRSITQLFIGSYREIDYFGTPPTSMTKTAYFPPQLEILSIPSCRLSSKSAKLLPSSITKLSLAALSAKVLEILPKGLKCLDAYPTSMTPNIIKFLPSSLTSLNISYEDADSDFLDQGGKKFDRCASADWDSYPLPPGLTKLTLFGFCELQDCFLANQSLPILQTLDLAKSTQLTDLFIPLLSPTLTHLSLASASKVSGKSFPFLPQSLTWLDLGSSVSIFDSDIQHLPRKLKRIHIDSAIHLTNDCIPNLPKILEKLDISKNNNITPSCFPQLPYPIRTYHCSSPDTKAAIFAKWYVINCRIALEQ